MSIDIESVVQDQPTPMRPVAAPRVEGPTSSYIEPDYAAYKALSTSAVVSCVLGVLSIATLMSYEYGLALGVIPIVAIVLGVRALWVIHSNPLEFTGKRPAQVGVVLATLFLLTGWGLAGMVYATEVPEGYERLSYADLQPDESVPGQIVPPDVMKWNGKRIFIKGYVYPGQVQKDNIKRFVLCRDNGDCCFGGNPKLTDRILVELADPLRLTYSRRLQRLAGTFRVQPGEATEDLGGGVVYHLDADHLE
jgi:hypothetical protein